MKHAKEDDPRVTKTEYVASVHVIKGKKVKEVVREMKKHVTN